MNSATKGAWRSLRYLLLIACAGGVLAADNTWISTVNLSLASSLNWFSGPADSPDAIAVYDTAAETRRDSRNSMGHLINGLLFDRPAGRWALDSRAVETHSSLARRIVEFDQINPISGIDNFSAYRMPASFAPIVTAPSRVLASTVTGPTSPSAVTASGNWTSNASGNWGNSANWSGGVIADGAGNTAHFDTLDITTDVTVSLDTSRTIGHVQIGDTNGTHRYTIAPAGATSLTFDSGTDAPATLQQSSTSAGDTISAPILMATSLDVTNLSVTNPLTISGNISANATGFPFLSFTGNVNVSGNISSGVTGASLSVGVNSGVTTFTGTNTYTGFTSVEGTLLVNGNNSGATGTTFVSGSGSVLGGTGTVGGNVQTFDGTITGATTTTVGTLTFLGNVDLSTGEGTGTYLANLSGSMSDLLAITGTLSLGQGSILDIDGVGDGITTYTLATFASRDDVFGTVMDIPGNYTLVYHDTDIQLVPIPEPSTWIGGALAIAAIGVMRRRRRSQRSEVSSQI